MDVPVMEYKLKKRKKSKLCKADLPLNIAVYKLRQEITAAKQDQGSDQWFYTENWQYIMKRLLEIDPNLKDVSEDEVFHVFITQRKAGHKKGKEGSRDQILRLILERGSCECHWKHNFPGKCSDDLSLDRLLPGHRDGTYDDRNVVISCLFHNVKKLLS